MQLAELAQDSGLTKAGMVSQLILREIEARGLTSKHASLATTIRHEKGVPIVHCRFFGEHDAEMSPDEAASLAGTFREVTGKPGAVQMNLDAQGAVVMRKGAGVHFQLGRFIRVMTVEAAREIASELRVAAIDASVA